METQSLLDHALDCGYIDPEVHRLMDAQWQEIGAMINGMVSRADDFCRNVAVTPR